MNLATRGGWGILVAALVALAGCHAAKHPVEEARRRPAEPAPSAPPAPAARPVSPALEAVEVTGSRVTSAEAARVRAEPGKDAAYAPSPAPIAEIGGGLAPAQAGVLTAGDYDDLLNPQLYARYAERYLQDGSQRDLPFVDTRTAVKVRVVGRDGQPVAFAEVSIADDEGGARRLVTAANGIAVFYPGLDRLPPQLNIRASAPGTQPVVRRVALEALPDDRVVPIQLDVDGRVVAALDLLLVIDATGSMTDELAYLQAELDAIVAALQEEHAGLDLRLGLIVYRDQGDEYVTRSAAFTEDLAALRAQLSAQRAAGGGDYPEAVHLAFAEAVAFTWRTDAVKVLLHVADAPPHPDRMSATWEQALRLRERGVHILPVAASGVADQAEYLMRSMAALTQSRYLFLTDDSGVGLPHAEPDVACYVVTRLDGLIGRVLASFLSGRRVEPAPEAILRRVGDYDRGLCLPQPAPRPRR